ncbi:Cyclin-dependent kinase-like 4 [Paramyrothecium foliicola]|nr:Cyclin-dependent kinase-like 4 [Paramyrothecium foliicola]
MGLGDELRAAIQRQASSLDKGFIPLDKIDSIITRDSIRNEIFETPELLGLFADYGDNLIDNILGFDSTVDHATKKTRIFAILALIGCVRKISHFLDGSINDDILPISIDSITNERTPCVLAQDRTTSLASYFGSWDQSDIEAFERQQWLVLAPVFGRDAPFLNLSTNAVLPFILDEDFAPRRGGTSKIFRVKIHPSHLDTDTKEPLLTFAVKRIRSHEKDSFCRELQALRRFNSAGVPQHPNILEFLSAWHQDGYFNIIFPWAVSDLSEWWRNNPSPLSDSGTKATLWLANQALGITSGLSAVHKFLGSSEPNYLGYAGHHGDIKPGNILWFPDTEKSDGLGTWKIADFGLSGVGSSLTRINGERLGCTPAYRAPEYDAPDHEITTAYDVWSLGCVLLECLTWSLIGLRGIQELESRRYETGTSADKGDAAFWETSTSLNMDDLARGKQPAVKLNVTRWIEKLRNVSREQSSAVQAYVEELSVLIETKMLVVDEHQRGLSTDVAAEIRAMSDRLSQQTAVPDDLPIDSSAPQPCFSGEDVTLVVSPNNLEPLTGASCTLPMPDISAPLIGETPEAMIGVASSKPVDEISRNHYPGLLNTALSTTQGWASLEGYPSMAFDETHFGGFATEPTPSRVSSLDFANSSATNGIKRHRDTTADQGSQVAPAKHRRLEPLKPTYCTEGHHATSGRVAAERSNPSPSKSLDTSVALRFACPFHKHDPHTFGIHDPRWRTCVGPGWTTIHRVKEHIDRKHSTQPNTCSRCSIAFASPLELSQHHKSATPCKVSGENHYRVTEAQRALMRKRPRGRSEVGAWNDIYRIIFELSESDPIPWPYHEAATTAEKGPAKPAPQPDTALLNDFEAYLTQSVIPSADRETMTKIQGAIIDIGQCEPNGLQPTVNRLGG